LLSYLEFCKKTNKKNYIDLYLKFLDSANKGTLDARILSVGRYKKEYLDSFFSSQKTALGSNYNRYLYFLGKSIKESKGPDDDLFSYLDFVINLKAKNSKLGFSKGFLHFICDYNHILNLNKKQDKNI